MPQGEYLQYGGQAIIEGVMMRSPRFFSVAVRAPNGDIVLEAEPLEKTWIGRQKWLMKPFLRGTFALLDAMALGIKAMRFAGNIQINPNYQPQGDAGNKQGPAVEGSPAVQTTQPSHQNINSMAIGAAMFVGLAMGVGLFIVLPNFLAEATRKLGNTNPRMISYAAEVIKIVLLLGYLWLIGKMPDIHRVFMYHGAEHKAINTFEAGEELTLENCRRQTRLHPRCGTSFAIIVLIVSLLIFPFVPRYPIPDLSTPLNVLVRVIVELLILPLVAGTSYELLRIAGKLKNKSVVMAFFWPGLMSQYLTTVEPTDDQIEVSLNALKACIDKENALTSLSATPASEPALSP